VTFHHGQHSVHLPIGLWIEGRGTPSHHDLHLGVFTAGPSNEPPRVGVGLVGNGTGVEDTELGFLNVTDVPSTQGFQLLPHSFCVVLVGFAAEGPE
jgi:hypothetical protein